MASTICMCEPSRREDTRWYMKSDTWNCKVAPLCATICMTLMCISEDLLTSCKSYSKQLSNASFVAVFRGLDVCSLYGKSPERWARVSLDHCWFVFPLMEKPVCTLAYQHATWCKMTGNAILKIISLFCPASPNQRMFFLQRLPSCTGCKGGRYGMTWT